MKKFLSRIWKKTSWMAGEFRFCEDVLGAVENFFTDRIVTNHDVNSVQLEDK
jgi:hypothetical protein